MRIRSLFGFRDSVDRSFYFRWGLGLMLLKYAVDATLVRVGTGTFWTPLDYLIPSIQIHGERLSEFPAWLSVTLLVWTLPFIWIGVSMTLRRAVDAGRSPWLCMFFFVPILNYALMLWLSRLPHAATGGPPDPDVTLSRVGRIRSAMMGSLASIGIGLMALLLNVFVLRQYGPALFFGAPFLLGVGCGYIHNRGHLRSWLETAGVVALTLVVLAGSLLLFALEGVVCLAMAFPLALVPALLGGEVGRRIANRPGTGRWGFAPALLLLPVTSLFDLGTPADGVREVVSSIEIAAPPARVWKEVVAFDRIERGPGGIFRLGVAYPVRATIDGAGVGAIRRCEFSTGAFVEPITTWDEPRRLAFGVTEQPPPLEEWSPYRRVYAPHLNGYFRSERGEFRLVAEPGGGTRLEGSTWYRLDIRPRLYWAPMADAILHSIHQRVLRQVKENAEAGATPPVFQP